MALVFNVELYVKMIEVGETERIGEEKVVAYFKVLFRHLFRGLSTDRLVKTVGVSAKIPTWHS
jgi:hypothetical protein